MMVPRIEKITLNMGVGEAKQDKKLLEQAIGQLAQIAGQQPNVRRARKSIATYKLRDGMPVGVAVTLRDARMYEFLDRLISIAIPRVRDFRGLNPKSFDGRGNYAMGIKEQIIFPEIDYDEIDRPWSRRDHHHFRGQRRAGQGTARRVRLPVQEDRAVAARGCRGVIKKATFSNGKNFTQGSSSPVRRSTRPASTRAATSAAVRVRCTASSASAASACANSPTKGYIPGMTKSSW